MNNKFFLIVILLLSLSCGKSSNFILTNQDISINSPFLIDGKFIVYVDEPFNVTVESGENNDITYNWLLDDNSISNSKNLEYTLTSEGEHTLILRATQGEVTIELSYPLVVVHRVSPYITKVFDYMPAVGSFINLEPKYEIGDTPATMNQKVLDIIGNNNQGVISLGGFGGYIVVGFDEKIVNHSNKNDFKVLGNSFRNTIASDLVSGSFEPGIIMVSVDTNNDGLPNDEWYEIWGSAHHQPTAEKWYTKLESAGCDMRLIPNYEITYYRPESEPQTANYNNYIKWEDNQGASGFIPKGDYTERSYFPQWIDDNSLTLKGTRLPQNGMNESSEGLAPFYALYQFDYGYADNAIYNDSKAEIDIAWAVDSNGNSVELESIDFIKIYSGVHQINGDLLECSTEIQGITIMK